MTEAGLIKVEEAKKNGQWYSAIAREEAELPEDLRRALAANKKALRNFESFAPSLRKQFLWWVADAKREETRQKRIRETVSMAEQNKKPGLQ